MATRKPAELKNRPRALTALVDFGTLPAALKYVADGDTIGVLLDKGGADYGFRTVRLAAVDADELDDPDPNAAGRARAAKAFLEALLPEGRHVLVRGKGVDDRDRIVAEVTGLGPSGSPVDVGEELLRTGRVVDEGEDERGLAAATVLDPERGGVPAAHHSPGPSGAGRVRGAPKTRRSPSRRLAKGRCRGRTNGTERLPGRTARGRACGGLVLERRTPSGGRFARFLK